MTVPPDERRGYWPAPSCRVLRDTDVHVLAGGKPEAVDRACRSTALVEGGQAHEAHELWSAADRLTAILAVPAGALIGTALAFGLAAAADAFGKHVLSRLL